MTKPVTDPASVFATAERLARHPRWTELLDGLDGIERNNMAILLENQYRFLHSVGRNPDKLLAETTTSVGVGMLDKFAFPIIRSMMPNLIMQEVASVQPMPVPQGQVFYMDIVYGDAKGAIAKNSSIFDSRTGVSSYADYSKNQVSGIALTIASNDITGTPALPANQLPVLPGSARIVATLSDGTQIVLNDNGNGAWVLVAGTATISSGAITYTTGACTLVIASDNIVSATLQYSYPNEANDNVMQVDLQFTSAPVVARVDKLRVRLSLEAIQNMQSLHGIDAQVEAVNAMQQVIGREIDRTGVNEMYKAAGAGSVKWDKATPPGVDFQRHKYTIIDSFIAGTNLVYKATRRVRPNWIICGIDVSTVVESLKDEFVPAGGALATQSRTGPMKLGTLAGRWEVYVDPDMPSNAWVMGFKGSNFMDAGFVYAPYIPLMVTDPVTLDDFMTRQGAMTQYGMKVVNSLMFSTGTITNVT